MNQDNKNNEGIDLSGSLKDSGVGVKFEEYRTPTSYYPETPKIIQWVIKYSGGLVKDENQASYVLIVFVVVGAIVTLILIFTLGSSDKKVPKGYKPPGMEIYEQQGIPMR